MTDQEAKEDSVEPRQRGGLRFGDPKNPLSPQEAGKRGGTKAEENRLARIGRVTQALEAKGMRAAKVLGAGLEAETRTYDSKRGEVVTIGPDMAERRQNALAILDRIGVSPKGDKNTNDVNVSVELMTVLASIEDNNEGRTHSTLPPIDVVARRDEHDQGRSLASFEE